VRRLAVGQANRQEEGEEEEGLQHLGAEVVGEVEEEAS
jgi:hypothetical protein